MVDISVLLRKLTSLDEYLRDLHETEQITWTRFQKDKIFRRFVERTLHLAIECCLDIGNHIISYEGYRVPLNNKDVFSVLSEQNVITMDLLVNLQKMAQFRNVLVHEYLRIQPEIVFAILTKHLGDLDRFADTIRRQFCLDNA